MGENIRQENNRIKSFSRRTKGVEKFKLICSNLENGSFFSRAELRWKKLLVWSYKKILAHSYLPMM
jgi:hypothetical protein